MVSVRLVEALLSVGGLGIWFEFLSTPVPTPVGLVLALAVLPTGDLIRLATAVMNKKAKQINAAAKKNS